jgi:hypothetical protein
MKHEQFANFSQAINNSHQLESQMFTPNEHEIKKQRHANSKPVKRETNYANLCALQL